MIKISILLLAVVGLSFAVDLDQEWSDWKAKYGKSYLSDIEEQWRREVWNRNYDTVVTHNTRGGSSYELEMNQFADLTSKEFNIIYNGYLNINDDSKTVHWYSPSSNGTLPDAVDWRDKGYVTEVKNQGKCGSCWAFSTTGSLEGQHFKATGKLVSLSEQNLVDCVKVDMGCRGGLMIDAFKYIEKNGGIDTEKSYPYKAKNEKCHFKESDVGATMKSYIKIPKENCILLKDAVAKVGPISVAMDAGHNSFQLYKSGIYDPRICSKTKLDHGVLVVGYGSEGGTDYWIVKNSWGPHWGMEGYFKIEAKKDLCGICTSASYPVV